MSQHQPSTDEAEGIIYAPCERAFKRVLTTFKEFIHLYSAYKNTSDATFSQRLFDAYSGKAENCIEAYN